MLLGAPRWCGDPKQLLVLYMNWAGSVQNFPLCSLETDIEESEFL